MSVGRQFLKLFVPLAALLTIVFALAVINERDDFRAQKTVVQESLLARQLQTANTELHATLADAYALVDITLHHLSQPQSSGNLIEQLAPEYSAFSVSRLVYDQVRYLDRTGMEVVRVNLVQGKPVVVPGAELQNKAERYYFVKGMERQGGEVHLSKLDLNMEHGRVELPYKPMIRISTPVVNDKGEKNGLVVLNFLAEGMIERLRKASLAEGERIFLLNHDGYWLLGPDKNDEWGFMFPEGKEKTMKAIWPDVWDMVSATDKGSRLTQEGFVAWDTLSPFAQLESANGRTFAGVADDEWKIVLRTHPSAFTPPWWNIALVAFALFMVEPAGLTWVYASASVRRAEAIQELKRSRDQLITITDTVQDAIIMMDSTGRIRFWNKPASEMFGYRADEVLGNEMHPLICSEDDVAKAHQAMEGFLETGKGRLIGGLRIVKAMKKGGETFPAEISLGAVKVGEEWWAVGAVRDISGREKLETQLRQAQKMEAIGLLAGGVAHDFNNILSIIIGYASFLDAKITDGDPLKEKVSRILVAGEKAANLTQSLLAFSRKQSSVFAPCNINDLVYGFQKMLSRLLTEDIELRLNLSVEEMVVMADKGQVEQVLMNLVTNARDAMPNGGKILISTIPCELDEGFVKLHGFGEPGSYLLLSVEDTGMGMDEKTRVHIFEPFFTTKEVGKGTGLGLAMVYGTVKGHNGFINVYSEPGHGTTFKIYLPMVEEAEEVKEEVVDPATLVGTETVLLVEDEVEVRAVTRATLEAYGYEVIEAVDGEDAVRVFSESMADIDLVISDVVMPKKNGREAIEAMKKLKPDVKAVFLSGYTADIIMQKGGVEGVDVISKPFRQVDFLKKIRDVLSS